MRPDPRDRAPGLPGPVGSQGPCSTRGFTPILRTRAPNNVHDFVWGDSVYAGACIQDLAGFESLIHEKGVRNHPLSDLDKELNRFKACVKHVFGSMTMSMGRKLTGKIWLARTEVGAASEI